MLILKELSANKEFVPQTKSFPLIWCSFIACVSFGVCVLTNIQTLYKDNFECTCEEDIYTYRAYLASVCKSSELYTEYQRYHYTWVNTTVVIDYTQSEKVIQRLSYIEDIPYIIIVICFSFCSGIVYEYFENGSLKSLLDSPRHEINYERKDLILKDLELFIISSIGLDSHQSLIFLCELAQFIAVIIQIEIVDFWLGGIFKLLFLKHLDHIGLVVTSVDKNDRPPLKIYFPTQVTCTYDGFYGSGGEITVSYFLRF